MTNIAACNMIVSGRVQGVMYRDFVQRKASGLGLVGEVENMPDKTVHVYAEGDTSAIEKLIPLLKKGTLLARVDSVELQWVQPKSSLKDFSIRY